MLRQLQNILYPHSLLHCLCCLNGSIRLVLRFLQLYLQPIGNATHSLKSLLMALLLVQQHRVVPLLLVFQCCTVLNLPLLRGYQGRS